jgi:two-component system, NarL family, nitrate/nitrite response regulator NarL
MRILLADRQDLVREALAGLFEAAGLPIVTQCRSLSELHLALVADPYDLALIDSTIAAAEDVAQLKAAFPEVKIALLVSSPNRDMVDTAFRVGAIGIIPKMLSGSSAMAAIHRMLAGTRYDPTDADMTVQANTYALTRRELDVLRGLFAGKSNKEIGRDLELQEVTVKLHVKTLSRKLGAKNRTHAAMIARNEGLV